MSDYSSTFTEGTGDTIDASDFSIEFDAIETAVNSKYDSNDLLDEDDMASDSATKFPSQQSTKAYVDALETTINAALAGNRMVLFDNLQALVNSSSTSSTGVTKFDMSGAGGDAAAAATAGATSAILLLSSRHLQNGGVSASNLIIKVAAGDTLAGLSNVAFANSEAGSLSGDWAHDTNTVICPLDGNSDFDYSITVDDCTTVSAQIFLVGYYY